MGLFGPTIPCSSASFAFISTLKPHALRLQPPSFDLPLPGYPAEVLSGRQREGRSSEVQGLGHER